MKAYSFAATLAFAAIAAFSLGAHAAPVTYEFENVDNSNSVENFTSGGLPLEVSGFSGFDASTFQSTGARGVATNINGSNDRLGVNGGISGLMNFGEALQFDFRPNKVVFLSSVVFELGSSDEQFSIFNGQTFVRNVTFSGGSPGGLAAIDLSADNIIGRNFTLATTNLGGAENGVRIDSITVEAVPVPAAAVLMATGAVLFGGAAGLRRRRKSAA